MGGFDIALTNVLLILLYMTPGFLLCKAGRVSEKHLPTVSTLLIYGCSPCMIVSSFLNIEYSLQNLKNMGIFFVVTLVLQSLFMGILFLMFNKKYEDSRYRILTIGSVLGNVGFFGMPLIREMLPDHPMVICYSSTYVVSMNVLVFTVGVYCLTKDVKYVTLKSAILNPSTIAFLVAIPLYLLKASTWLPDFALSALDMLGRMTTPLCMLILGVRLGKMSFKALFSNLFVYLTALGKLVLFPLFCFACVYFIPFDMPFKISVIILSATPCGSVILNLAEIHKSEQEMSANILLLSTLLCIITIPVMVYFVGLTL